MNDVRTSHECKITSLPLPPPPNDLVPIRREDIKCLNGDGFLLYNVISPSECKFFMEQADQAGFDEITYKKSYRNNTRVTAFSHELSNLLFERIKCYLPEEIVVEKGKEMEKTSEFGTAGKWKLLTTNECWRFCRYAPGGHFGPHHDGSFARNLSERSFYTFMIYLNGGFEGGETNFLKKDTQLMLNDGVYKSNVESIVEQVKPEAGLALIFLHPNMHEGAVLKDGLKYILRSDIMYRREEAVANSPKDEEALKLFHEAQELEVTEPMKAAELYRRAFKLSPALANAYRV